MEKMRHLPALRCSCTASTPECENRSRTTDEIHPSIDSKVTLLRVSDWSEAFGVNAARMAAVSRVRMRSRLPA